MVTARFISPPRRVFSIVGKLVEAGADLNARDNLGLDFFDYCYKYANTHDLDQRWIDSLREGLAIPGHDRKSRIDNGKEMSLRQLLVD